MPTELHIASLVVHAHPPRLAAISRRIAAMPEVRIHGTSPSGKLVVTVEGHSAHQVVDQLTAMQRMPGVLNVALVFQHVDADPGDNPPAPDPDAPHASALPLSRN